jgi:HTH-type transcriptional regulator/antitoxin HigA
MIRNEREYDQAVKRLNGLLDEIGTDERHPLYGLLDTLGTLIHAYEERHEEGREVSGAEMLRYLMDEHGVSESDLRDVGSRRALADILRARRNSPRARFRAPAGQFYVPPVFI